MEALSHPVPALAPVPTDRTPLQHRRSPEFEHLCELDRCEEEAGRLLQHYLGSARPDCHCTTLGTLRIALAWHALPGFLEREGWTVAGSFGTSHKGEPAPPEFRNLRLGPEMSLEAPENLHLFLSRRAERLVLAFSDTDMPCTEGIDVELIETGGPSGFLERWFEHARGDNPLRGRRLRASGVLAEDGPELRAGELFLPGWVRQRIDRIVQRFLGTEVRRLAALGVRARGGAILAGRPGTGKTSLGRELAARLACTFLWVTPGELENAEKVREVYELARWLAPTLVFLEDLDLVAESRERWNHSTALGQLMNELDGAAGDHPVLTIATTNRLHVVEDAIRNRPGRFDQVLEIGPPDAGLRRAMVARRLGELAGSEEIDWVCARLDGATGAEIEEVLNGALAAAVFESPDGAGAPRVERAHLLEALAAIQRAPEGRAVGFEGGGA